MANNSIDEVKTIIRGLLVSSPVEVTVLKLRRDFRAQEGQDIPFYEFGFHDVTSFLRSIPDVCKICNNDSGPYAIVKLVESVKSAHVSSLVLRQKTTFKGRRRQSSVSNRGRPSRLSLKPAVNSYKNKTRPLSFDVTKNGYLPKTAFNFSGCNETSSKSHKLPELPAYNSVHQSCNGYDNNVETWLNGNEEESAMQEVYPCIPDTNGSEFVDVESMVDYSLRDILISDEGLLLKDVEEYLKDVLSSSATNYGNLNTVNFEQIIRNLPYVRILDNYIYHEQFLISECEEPLPEESFNMPESPVVEIKESLEDESSKICKKGELTAHAIPFVPQGVNEKVHRLERNLFSLMKDNIHGILGSELKEKYKMKYAAPLNFQILGCETTKELAFKMPHIFNYIPLENGDFKLFPACIPVEKTSKGAKEEESRSKIVPHVPEITIRNMQWLMQGYPNGLNSRDFEQTYRDTYLQGIELKQMGLSSFEEFFQSLEKLNVIKIEVYGSDTWLFPCNNSANSAVFDKPLPFKEIIENEHDLKKMKEQFPRDVVGPDLHVKQVEIPSWIMKGSLIEVLVQEVNNPHHFWLTFCGEQYSRALDSLMDDLQAFYCSKSHSYRMPSEFIREGQDCVTQFIDEWHRARVTSIISATEVEVCFYDYGTRRVVPKDNIHYLHTAHSALPAQAIRAVLANIAPMGDKWTPDASKRFLQLIANKALIGIVISADFTNKLFSLFLCDTSGDDDIYIHEVLISEGYAVETGFDYNEKESNKSEINDFKTEGPLNSESLLMMEEESEEKQKYECGDNLVVKSPPVLNSINHDDISLRLDTAEVLKSEISSRISTQSSLLTAVRKDSLNCSPSVSESFCLVGSSVSSDGNASVVPETENNSSGHRKQSAPPPGFSQTSKCEIESNASDKTESLSLRSRSNLNQQSVTEPEAPTRHTGHDIESEKKDPVGDTANETSDHGESVKGVSSGVNADFSHTKAPYLPNYYTYPNWPTLPQTFPNFPVMPSFPPVNALAPLSLSPFNMPHVPNPMDICNMWYYEHCRQQAFLQGLLAREQMAASAFPPLPPGLYLPQSYSTMPSRNQMNISEVHSPDQTPSMKSNLKENSSACQDACINIATQTEVASADEGSETELTQEMITAGVSSLEKGSEITSSEFSPLANEDGTYLLRKCSRSEFLASEDKDSNIPANAPSFESTVDVSSEGVFSKDIVENGTCGSTFLTNEPNNQSVNKCKNDLEPSSQCNVSKDVTKKSSSPLLEDNTKLTMVVDDTNNFSDSQNKIEKVQESCNLEHESTKVLAAPNSCVDRSLDIHNLEVQFHKEKLPLQNIPDLQRECNTKLARKDIVHSVDRNVNNIHRLEGSESTIMKESLKISQNSNHGSAMKSDCVEVEEQEIARVEFTEIPYEAEIDLHEDDSHEQEMIEKAQQEYVVKTCAENNSRYTTVTENLSREKKAAIHNKLLAKEYLDMVKEEKTNSEVSSGIQTSACKKFSFESSEKKKFEKGGAKDWLDKFQGAADHVLEQEHFLTVPEDNSCRNSEMPSSINGSYKISQKSHSMSEMMSAELGALSVSNEHQDSIYPRQFVQQSETCQEHPGVKVQKQEFHSNLSKGDERIVNSACKTNLSKQVQPVFGAKLSSEVSASYISGPTQPAMSQNSQILAPTRLPDQSKDNVSCETILSCQTASWRTTWSSEELSRNSVQRPSGRDLSRNSPFRNSANQNSTNRHKDSSGKRMTGQQFVKNIYLCNKKIHQINLDGRPYVLTDEIVDYFTPFNGRHVILKILEARKVEINFLELSRRRRPELFECLDKSEIVCRGLNRGPTGNVIGSIHIVPLRSVPYMLRALNKDDEALAMDVKEEMEKFDASDPYWTGCYD